MKHLSSFILLSAFLLSSSLVSANVVQDAHTEVELISEVQSVGPGTETWLALRFKMDPEWHIYWKNPGDSGTKPEIAWQLPEGVTAGEIQWPFPKPIRMDPLVNYGYEGEVLLLVPLRVSDKVKAGRDLVLKADVDFLACKIECIPGTASLELRLPVNNAPPEPDTKWQSLFKRFKGRLPVKPDFWNLTAEMDGEFLKLSMVPPQGNPAPVSEIYFFPENEELIQHAAGQIAVKTTLGSQLAIPLSVNRPKNLDYLKGLLVISDQALDIDIPIRPPQSFPLNQIPKTAGISLITALVFAFLGGIILNLMPCVLPVLSIKILGFVKEADSAPGSLFRHGLVFTAGVLVSFWLLAEILIVLKAAGSQIGWGFQLQSPVFLTALTFLFFLFALNLFGVFEVGTSLAGAGQKLTQARGCTGSFASGVLATVVATPCTAPFMGSALGFALAQPAWVSLAVFTALGLGMASPFLLLCSNPALIRFIPKPGPWMITMKQVLGFLLLATVLWLVWVFSLQTSEQSVIVLLGGLFLAGTGAWILGKWTGFESAFSKRAVARLLALAFIAGGIFISIYGIVPESNEFVSKENGMEWEPYSDKRLAALRAEKRPVFIDFTAAWCLTCQVNKHAALHTSRVENLFREKNIAALKADWTNKDESITRALARYGRSSIPLYVYYPAGAEEPVILPELLTPQIVAEAVLSS